MASDSDGVSGGVLVDMVGVAMRILVGIPFNLIVMISPGSMLGGTLTRKPFSLEGTGLIDSCWLLAVSDEISL